MSGDTDDLRDQQALRELVYRYAHCADTRDGPGYAALFAADGVLEGAAFRYAGTEDLAGVAPQLSRFAKTYHMVFNCLFVIDGDEATGEIYSAAHHLTPDEDGRYSDLVMHITYRDRYRRTADGWRIAKRTVDLLMTETRPVSVPAPL
jgi:hypothetical protein